MLPGNRALFYMRWLGGACFGCLLLFGIGRAAATEQDSVKTVTVSWADSVRNTGMVYHIAPQMDYVYSRPHTGHFLIYSLSDLKQFSTNTFRRDNLLRLGVIMAGTGVLFALDQAIVDEAQRLARRWHIPADNKVKSIANIAGFPIYVPNSTGSMLYYLGDGSMHFMIAGSFLTYGLIKSDNRALQTTSQLAEGMITVGIATQILKHITGHETPCRSTAPGGVWRPFPNQIEYHKHVSTYDAFPSGHLATAMMTVTVLAENYPNNKLIRPIGYTLMSVLGFQMLNNGVHWASDYPVGIAIGYSMAKLALSRGRTILDARNAAAAQPRRSLSFYPMLNREQMGLGVCCGL